jgi:hypothetical protein
LVETVVALEAAVWATLVISVPALRAAAVHVLGHVLAGGHHELEGLGLDALGDLGEAGHVLGGGLGRLGHEVGDGLGVVRGLGLGGGHARELRERVLHPLGRKLGRLLGGLDGDGGHLLGQAAWDLARFSTDEVSTGKLPIMSFIIWV